MFAYLKGEITHRSPTNLTLEVNGVGYHLHIPMSTFSAVQGLERATIFTHFHVREDVQALYGFSTQAERNLFVQLISVSGVGPNTAQLILSSMTAEEIRAAVIAEQAHILQRVKGIGAKTAKQIILDLKDKLTRESSDGPSELFLAGEGGVFALREEALSALLALGFNRIAVQKALNSVIKENPGVGKVEELIKLALKALA